MNDWIDCGTKLPPQGVTVKSKIQDEKGERNETTLKLVNGLWYAPDDSMYVYYHPTHWRACTTEEQAQVLAEISKPKHVPTVKFA